MGKKEKTPTGRLRVVFTFDLSDDNQKFLFDAIESKAMRLPPDDRTAYSFLSSLALKETIAPALLNKYYALAADYLVTPLAERHLHPFTRIACAITNEMYGRGTSVPSVTACAPLCGDMALMVEEQTTRPRKNARRPKQASQKSKTAASSPITAQEPPTMTPKAAGNEQPHAPATPSQSAQQTSPASFSLEPDLLDDQYDADETLDDIFSIAQDYMSRKPR